MNQPLTNPHPEMPFSNKTFPNHPQWHNQPLRLTEEERLDPLATLDDFFSNYHLNDIRQILWEWLVEVVSSTRSISVNGADRSNHVYFYEKVEAVIEAAFVIRNRNRQAIQNEVILNKSKELIEFVQDAPIYVKTEVFKGESLACISDHLKNWFQVALSDESSIYEVGEQRQQLIAFHEELQVFIEALFLICYQCTHDDSIKKKAAVTTIRLLNRDQITNPFIVITAFFNKFPMHYVTRELNDWLESGVSYQGAYPDTMSELQALHTYRIVLCLINAARKVLVCHHMPITGIIE